MSVKESIVYTCELLRFNTLDKNKRVLCASEQQNIKISSEYGASGDPAHINFLGNLIKHPITNTTKVRLTEDGCIEEIKHDSE